MVIPSVNDPIVGGVHCWSMEDFVSTLFSLLIIVAPSCQSDTTWPFPSIMGGPEGRWQLLTLRPKHLHWFSAVCPWSLLSCTGRLRLLNDTRPFRPTWACLTSIYAKEYLVWLVLLLKPFPSLLFLLIFITLDSRSDNKINTIILHNLRKAYLSFHIKQIVCSHKISKPLTERQCCGRRRHLELRIRDQVTKRATQAYIKKKVPLVQLP